MEHYLPAQLIDPPSRSKAGRLVMEFITAYLTIQELIIRSFVKPASCIAFKFHEVKEDTSHIAW